MDHLKASVLVFDTRNFTNNLNEFSAKKDDSFVLLIQEICNVALNIADKLSLKLPFYFNSTGDGFIVIYFGNKSSVRCYLLGLMLSIFETNICDSFFSKSGKIIKFGIGMESGYVQEINASSEHCQIKTYIGNVINVASRIESETKAHARANIILGNEINNDLVHELLNQNYSQLMNLVKNGSGADDVVCIINEMNSINQKLLLSYLFEHVLKGVNEPAPLFRVSPSLSRHDGPLFKPFIVSLLDSIEAEQYLREFILSNIP